MAFLGALALLGLAWTPQAAHAHAELLETMPEDGAVLDRAPPEIVLRFNEAVTPVIVRLAGARGEAVVLPASAVDRTVRARLPRSLVAGSYLVSWRVVSTDSHPVGGAFVFSLGAATKAPVAASDDQLRREGWWQFASMANRALGDAALLFAAGAALCGVLVFGGRIARPVRSAIMTAGAVAILSALASIALARGWIEAAPAAALLEPALWAPSVGAPLRGRVAANVAGLILMILGLWLARLRLGTALTVAGAVLACGGIALSGHVAALTPAWPAQAALALHALTAAFWIGALWPLGLAMRQRPTHEAVALLNRFSMFAVPAVAALVLAGVGVALTRIATVSDLIGTGYGRILLIKLAFVALMIAFAVRNRGLTRTLAAANTRAATHIIRNIRAEIGCAGAILLLTAILSHTPPGGGTVSGHDHDHGAAIVLEASGAALRLEIAPARRGANRLAAVLTNAHGLPIEAREITVELSLPQAGIEPLTRRLAPRGAGRFMLDRVELPVAGRWHVHAEALIGDFEKIAFTGTLAVE